MDNGATGFTAELTSNADTVITGIKWSVTSDGVTKSAVFSGDSDARFTKIALKENSGLIIGLIIDGLYDKNAEAEVSVFTE